MLKFIYSEKATKFCGISIVGLFYIVPVKPKAYGRDFAKFCGLLRIFEFLKKSRELEPNFGDLSQSEKISEIKLGISNLFFREAISI